MPKYRSIHTKITQSFDVNDMPDDFTRLVWVMLPLGLDCEGRGIFDYSWIKSKIFPLRKDISEKKLKKSLDWFISRKNPDTKLGMIEIYSVDGREYFYVPNFKTYQRGLDKEAPSILPAPALPTNSRPTPDQVQSNSPLKAEAKLKANAKVEAKADVKTEPEPTGDSTPEIQLILEKITGIPPSNAGDIQAIQEIEILKPLQDDIQAGFDWVISQGKQVHRYSSLVGPIRTAIAKRVQKPPGKAESVFEHNQRVVEELLQEAENGNT